MSLIGILAISVAIVGSIAAAAFWDGLRDLRETFGNK